jgi:hypothetical protein
VLKRLTDVGDKVAEAQGAGAPLGLLRRLLLAGVVRRAMELVEDTGGQEAGRCVTAADGGCSGGCSVAKWGWLVGLAGVPCLMGGPWLAAVRGLTVVGGH